jgi:hypothetical protein
MKLKNEVIHKNGTNEENENRERMCDKGQRETGIGNEKNGKNVFLPAGRYRVLILLLLQTAGLKRGLINGAIYCCYVLKQ